LKADHADSRFASGHSGIRVGEYILRAEAMLSFWSAKGWESYAPGDRVGHYAKIIEHCRAVRGVLRTEKRGGGRVADCAWRHPCGGWRAAGRADPRPTFIVAQGAHESMKATITGESLPRDKQVGDEVVSGNRLNGKGLRRDPRYPRRR